MNRHSSFCKYLIFCVQFIFPLFLFQTSALAGDINLDDLIRNTGSAAQDNFEKLSGDFGRAVFLNPGNSPEPHGTTGFQAAGELTFVTVDKDPIRFATGQNPPSGSVFPLPKIRAHKGLPWEIDVGLMYLPPLNEINLNAFGGEVRLDILEHIKFPTPLIHLSCRISVTEMSGVSDLDLQTVGYDITAGGDLKIIKPYVGIGQIHIKSSPQGSAALALSSATIKETHFIAGIKLNFIPLIPVNLEYINASLPSYSIKIGVEF